MNDYQERFAARVRAAAGAAVDQVLAQQPPHGRLEDLIGEAVGAASAAAADVWHDAMLWGDYRPPLNTAVNPSVARELGMFGNPAPFHGVPPMPADVPSFKDWPDPFPLDGKVTVAGGLVVRPADYRSAPDYRPAR